MTHARGILRLACLTAAFALATTAVQAQTEQSATQFYMAYRAAFAKATKVDELMPFMAKARRAEIEKTPAGERSKMFAFIKELDTMSQIKVIKETKSGQRRDPLGRGHRRRQEEVHRHDRSRP